MARAKAKAPCRVALVGEERGFFGLPACVIRSPAFRDLSVHARAVLIEIGVRMDGYNNGKIGADQRSIRKAVGCSPRKVVEAITELVEHGLLAVTVEGNWTAKMAREYRLTFVSTPRAPATNDYLHWSPVEKSSATDGVSARCHPATDAVTTRPKAATDAVTQRIRNPQKCVDHVPDAATREVAHILKPYPSPATGGSDEHKTPSKDPENTGGDFSASDLTPQGRAFAARVMGAAVRT